MATYGDESFAREAEGFMAAGRPHPCTCSDVSCPLNPNNPRNRERGRGCDACIRKNLALGEIPSCFFNKVGDIEGWDDFSYAGFVRFCLEHGEGQA